MLDLHGIRHKDVPKIFDNFIFENYDKSELKIITGNSLEMKKIIKDLIREYNYKINAEYSGFLIIK